MRIFPNNITETIWRSHLTTYSPSLTDHFEEYACILPQELGTIFPYQIYICPLCAKNYFIATTNGIYGNAEFSLDHLPPESVGGIFKLITCKKCNNDFGNCEAELLKLLDFGTIPDRKNNSLFPNLYIANKQTEERFKAILNMSDGNKANITFKEIEKMHNKKLKNFLSDLRNRKLPTLQVMIGSPDLDKVGHALLKSAYLLCFIWWGYEFVYSKNGGLIRKVLRNELKYPTTVPTVWHETRKNILSKGIGILSRNRVKESFMVCIGIKNEYGKYPCRYIDSQSYRIRLGKDRRT